MKRDRHSLRRPVTPDDSIIVKRMLMDAGISNPSAHLDFFRRWQLRRQVEEYKNEIMNILTSASVDFDALDLNFPNARAGQEYDHSVIIPPDRFADVRFDGLPEGCGLKLIDDGHGAYTLKGTPTDMADYELTVSCLPRGAKFCDRLVRKVPFLINPDPWNIWKNLPVSEDLPFKKDNEACEYVMVEEFGGVPQKDIVAASKRGRSHAHEGKPRDDDFSISFLPASGWYVMVVADGAGSARYSRRGSEIAVREFSKWCSTVLNENMATIDASAEAFAASRDNADLKPMLEEINPMLYDAAKEAYRAIERCKDNCETPSEMRDFSTTLLGVVCRKFSFGWIIASFSVGDGVIAVYNDRDGSIKLLNDPDGGEFAGQTRFLTMPSIFSDRPRTRITTAQDFTAIILMTDGVSDPFFETDVNLRNPKQWKSFWQELSSHVDFTDDNEDAKNQLLRWLDFRIAGNHDDRTIAVLY